MALKDLLRTADLAPADLDLLLDLADECRRAPAGSADVLRGQTVVHYFNKPSTRTRLSFAAAVARLGGTPVVIGPSELQLGRGETTADTARVVSRFAAAFTIRTYSDDEVAEIADAASIPVINALTDLHHPCQSLADLLTMRDVFGDLKGRVLAYVGDGNNVTHSLLEAGALAGVDVRVATPEGYGPDPTVVAVARDLARVSGASIEVGHDPVAAVRGADAVYADVWLSMGDPEDTRAQRVEALAPYRVTGDLMAAASDGAIFLHCLPVHRGEEVDAAVIDGSASRVFDQAENRMHTAQAVLLALIEGRLAGARGEPGAPAGG